MRAKGCSGFEVEEFVYRYKLKKLAILQLSDAPSYNVCIWSKIWEPTVVQMVWEERRCSSYFSQCLDLVLNCIGWVSKELM